MSDYTSRPLVVYHFSILNSQLSYENVLKIGLIQTGTDYARVIHHSDSKYLAISVKLLLPFLFNVLLYRGTKL